MEQQSNRPIMRLLYVLERRWALRLLWELRDGAPRTSRALRALCGDISPTVLQARLDDLREAALVERRVPHGYALTTLGAELLVAFEPLYCFAEHWAAHGPGLAAAPPRGQGGAHE